MQPFCDTTSGTFRHLAQGLCSSSSTGNALVVFNRTSDPTHQRKVYGLWERLLRSEAIYRGKHTGWYSVSDETFYTDRRVVDRLSPETGKTIKVALETGKAVQMVTEDNYKFRLSKYLPAVHDWLRKADPVRPRSRLNDLEEAFGDESGLADLSVSRCRTSNPWGIPVPGDPSQTIYVWLDALASYLERAPTDPAPVLPDIHIVGKDILKFHAIYWPAFLMAADLPLPRRIIAHGHWLVGRTKMSKSLGNVVDPVGEMQRFGRDAFRYLLLRLSKLDSDAGTAVMRGTSIILD